MDARGKDSNCAGEDQPGDKTEKPGGGNVPVSKPTLVAYGFIPYGIHGRLN